MNFIHRHNIIKKTFAYLILGLVGLLILNKAVFLHTHQLRDGTVIVHAHPFQSNTDSNPNNPHQHTKSGFFYFNELSLLYQSAPGNLTFYMAENSTILFSETISFYFQKYHACLKNRAPPVV